MAPVVSRPELGFRGYTKHDYLRDTSNMRTYRAQKRDIGERFFANNSLIEEAIKKQNQMIQESLEFQKKRLEMRDAINPNVNTTNKTNEFNERLNIFGDRYAEKGYEIGPSYGGNGINKRDIKKDINYVANVLTDRERNRILNSDNTNAMLKKIEEGNINYGEIRDRWARQTSNEWRQLNDLENITIGSHSNYYNKSSVETTHLLNQVSMVLNQIMTTGGALLRGANTSQTLHELIEKFNKIKDIPDIGDVSGFTGSITKKLKEAEEDLKNKEEKLKNDKEMVEKYQPLLQKLFENAEANLD